MRMLIATIIAFVLSFFVPQIPLREKSGLETLRDGAHELTPQDQDGDGIPDVEQRGAPVGEPGF